LERFTLLIKHYDQKNDTYFYDLFVNAQTHLEGQENQEQLRQMIESYDIKRSFIPVIKLVYQNQ
jgi:hypothetical protein